MIPHKKLFRMPQTYVILCGVSFFFLASLFAINVIQPVYAEITFDNVNFTYGVNNIMVPNGQPITVNSLSLSSSGLALSRDGEDQRIYNMSRTGGGASLFHLTQYETAQIDFEPQNSIADARGNVSGTELGDIKFDGDSQTWTFASSENIFTASATALIELIFSSTSSSNGGAGSQHTTTGAFVNPNLTLLSFLQTGWLGGYLDEGEIQVSWTDDDEHDLTVTEIIGDENPFLITFANRPFDVSKDEKIIRYNVQIPTEICEEEVQVGCIQPQLYEIPIRISGIVDNEPVSATETLKIDLTPPKFNIPLLPIILGGIVIGTVLIAWSFKKRKNSKKQQKRPTGNNKRGSAKESIRRKPDKKGKSGSAKASISRYK